MSQPRLRTKTGCLTCRKRRVKCDERRPNCNNCTIATRSCIWPAFEELTDGRWRTNSRPNRTARREPCSLAVPSAPPCTAPLLYDDEIEVALINYFYSEHFPVLLLPDVPNTFFNECRRRYLDLAYQSDGVKKAILACCASNKSIISGDPQLARQGLKYYAEAVTHVNATLTKVGAGTQEPDDCILAAVIFLYLYELWGPGQAEHAFDHVAGAIQLFSLRYQRRPPNNSSHSPMDDPLTRLMAESILYQSLMLSIRHPFSPRRKTDIGFLLWMKNALQPLWDGATPQRKSAILGVPLQLYHLILDTIALHHAPAFEHNELSRLERQMHEWEDYALSQLLQPSSIGSNGFVILYILATSLLLEWVAELSANTWRPFDDLVSLADQIQANKLVDGQPTPRWQTWRAVSVLRGLLADETQTLSFLASWPVLIVGYAVCTLEDIHVIRAVLLKMWQGTGYGVIKRIAEELCEIWRHRRFRRGQVSALDK